MQLNDGLLAFSLLWRKGMEDSTALCPGDNFFLICGKILPPYDTGMTFCQFAMSISARHCQSSEKISAFREIAYQMSISARA